MNEHLRVINPEFCANQYADAHFATLPPHLQNKVGRTQSVLITPAALTKRLADAWQAGFARAAEAGKLDVETIALAARRLYFAGRWTADGVEDAEAAQLWERLRDALGLPPGSATAAGLGAFTGVDDAGESHDTVRS